jgi:hypothetical protein
MNNILWGIKDANGNLIEIHYLCNGKRRYYKLIEDKWITMN